MAENQKRAPIPWRTAPLIARHWRELLLQWDIAFSAALAIGLATVADGTALQERYDVLLATTAIAAAIMLTGCLMGLATFAGTTGSRVFRFTEGAAARGRLPGGTAFDCVPFLAAAAVTGVTLVLAGSFSIGTPADDLMVMRIGVALTFGCIIWSVFHLIELLRVVIAYSALATRIQTPEEPQPEQAPEVQE